jgi:hypothetical protein
VTNEEANRLQTRQLLEDERSFLTDLLLTANLSRDDARRRVAQEELDRVNDQLRAT